MPLPQFRSLPGALRGRQGLLVGLVALELALLFGLVAAVLLMARDDDGEFVARETLLDQKDLPEGWMPVDAANYPYWGDSPLLRLLQEDETVAGAFAAYRDRQNSSSVATYVVFRPDAPPLLESSRDDSSLGELAPLVIEMERLARERLHGDAPPVFFAVTDVPVPGALRGRSLAPPEGEGVQSESILFTTGSVLALVVVEHPTGEEPFLPVEELAQLVHSRIQQQMD